MKFDEILVPTDDKWLEHTFETREQMFRALEKLIDYVRNRPSGSPGFILEQVEVEFSPTARTVTLHSRYAENSLRVRIPTLAHETPQAQQDRLLEIARKFQPHLKESQLRSTVLLFKLLGKAEQKKLMSEARALSPEKVPRLTAQRSRPRRKLRKR